jgi:hypothetical protein
MYKDVVKLLQVSDHLTDHQLKVKVGVDAEKRVREYPISIKKLYFSLGRIQF